MIPQLRKSNLDVLNDIEQWEDRMLQMDQAPCPLSHKFSPGLYIREVFMSAGTLAIGHHQNFTHWNVLLKGSVLMLKEDGTTTVLEAPLSFEGKPGRKIGYILEDMTWQNIYPTSETNVEKLEATYLSKSDSWKYNNSLQQRMLELKHEVDRVDYQTMLEDVGSSHSVALSQSENKDDQIELNLTSYKFCLAESPIQGRGIFATSDILVGENIAPARLGGFRTQVGRYTNHAVKPNARMQKLDNDDIVLIAIREIKGCLGGSLGEEITIDYRQAIEENKKIGVLLCQQ